MKIFPVIVLLLVMSARLWATPDDGIIQHETLIGYNNESYYCIQLVEYPSGTYYAHKDSAFLVARDFNTAGIKSRVFISSREHTDDTTLGDWHSTLVENKDFNLIDFIKEHSINYLYPEIYSFTVTEYINFKMDMEGLKVRHGYDETYQTVVITNRFDQAAPWIKKYWIEEDRLRKKYPLSNSKDMVKTKYFIGDGKYMFMAVTGELNADHSEIIIAFERNEIMPLVEKLKAQEK